MPNVGAFEIVPFEASSFEAASFDASFSNLPPPRLPRGLRNCPLRGFFLRSCLLRCFLFKFASSEAASFEAPSFEVASFEVEASPFKLTSFEASSFEVVYFEVAHFEAVSCCEAEPLQVERGRGAAAAGNSALRRSFCPCRLSVDRFWVETLGLRSRQTPGEGWWSHADFGTKEATRKRKAERRVLQAEGTNTLAVGSRAAV